MQNKQIKHDSVNVYLWVHLNLNAVLGIQWNMVEIRVLISMYMKLKSRMKKEKYLINCFASKSAILATNYFENIFV